MLRLGIVLVALALAGQVSAQVRPRVRVDRPVKLVKPTPEPPNTDLTFGASFTRSVLFLARNTRERNDAAGITLNGTYGGNRPFRASLEYTLYRSIDIAPTWYNIRASTLEFNGQAVFRSKSNIGFYLLAGFSYNVFKGYFTGKNDYLNLQTLYGSQQNITTRWLGFNTGVGFEYTVKRVVMFGAYKMRVGRSEGFKDVNVQDVCFSAGVRYVFKVPALRRLLKGPRNRYFLKG